MIDLLKSCQICPRRCKANRFNGEKGFCGAGKEIRIYSNSLHHGEEPPLSGDKGSGTIFFSYCNSRCVFCQNYKFSQENEGIDVSLEKLVEIMLGLEDSGAHNINLVTPTHFIPQIFEAVVKANEEGLKIPIVYNTNGYERPEILKLLKGIVDVYLPDMKYSSNIMALKYSSMINYPEYNRDAVLEMFNQVGNLVIENGIAKKGLIVRHLILPDKIAGTSEIMAFLADEISKDVNISLMSQYYPVYKSSRFPEINRRITRKEYAEAVECMQANGLNNGWCQEWHNKEDHDRYLGVNFNKT